MTFTLPELPFDKSALEPHISANTFDYHHGKHHQAYVDKANELIKGTPLEGMGLEQAVIEARKNGVDPTFNNIAQIYNHNTFWNSLTPNGGGEAPSALTGMMNNAFGNFENFKEQFIAAGMGQFGSGWVWLASNKGKFEIVKTANAETPLTEGKTPLLVCDVWEHAYYLDHQNKRADFLNAFIDHLANWEFAIQQLQKDIQMMSHGCDGGCNCSWG